MKFSCQTSEIQKEIGNAMDFTQQRNALSILSNIKLETKDNLLTITATDLMSGYTSTIPVETESEGTALVFGTNINEILHRIPDTQVSFEVKDNNLVIEVPTIHFTAKLRVMDPAEFPVLSAGDDVSFFEIGQKQFIDMSSQVSFSMGTDESRQYLCGIYLEKSTTGLNMVATDSRRLSIVQRKFEEQIPDFASVIVPGKFFQELKKLGTGEGTFSLGVAQGAIYARLGSCSFFTTLIKGPYPEYRRVIPPEQKYHCTAKTKDMLDAINRVSVSIDSHACKLYMHIEGDKLTLYSEGNEQSESKEEIDCSYDGESEGMNVCMNYQFLQAPLKAMDSETFTLCFNSPNNAFTLRPDGEHDYFHIIMPMQPGA